MGKMEQLIEYSEDYAQAVNYILQRECMTVSELLERKIEEEEENKIIDEWRSAYNFYKSERRRFVEKNPEYELVNELDILTPSGDDTCDCITAEDFVEFCENH